MGIRCFHCGKDNIDEQKKILISQDGDFVCDSKCQNGYEEQKAHFFNDIVHDAQKTEDWLLGKID